MFEINKKTDVSDQWRQDTVDLMVGPTQPPIQWVPGVLPPGVKWPERKADYSPQSNTEVKESGGIPPLLHMFLWHSA
jgi:hypothetical protein